MREFNAKNEKNTNISFIELFGTNSVVNIAPGWYRGRETKTCFIRINVSKRAEDNSLKTKTYLLSI